jgi:superfamily II DNA or RNA helicase
VSALRPYQAEALAAIHTAVARGQYRPFVALATGLGKNHILPVLHEQRGGRTLVVAHTERILKQTLAHFERAGLDAGLVKAEQRDYAKPIVVASIQTLTRPGHLEKLGSDFRTVVVDEAHHSAAAGYVNVVKALGAGTSADRVLVGMSATPYRGDGRGLDGVFGEVVFERDIVSMVPEWLADVRGKEIKLSGVNLDGLKIGTTAYGRDFQAGALGQILQASNAAELIVKAWRTHAPGRFTIAYAPTLEFAGKLALEFTTFGIGAEVMDGATPDADRDAMLERFVSGDTKVIVNCGVLIEGFDCPRTDCILIARPTKSKTLYTQMIGRATRQHPEKQDALVLSFTGASSRHTLISLGSLCGLQGSESIRESVVRRKVEREHAELAEAARAEIIARDVDVMRKSQIRWTAEPTGGLFTVGLGSTGGSIDLVERDSQWCAVFSAPKTEDYRETFLVSGVDLDEAMRLAETEIRRRGAARFADTSAEWLDTPASAKQLEAALKRGRSFPATATKRDVGAALSLEYAKDRQRRRTWPAWLRKKVAGASA